MSIYLAARFKAKDEAASAKIEQHLKTVREHALSDKEPGCKFYNPTRGKTDPLDWHVYEEYADQAAVDAHMASPAFQAFAAEAPNLIPGGVGGIDISFFQKI
ncbi:hypothetical protein CC85DRAFT_327040 [Cutaneotrichosporon oleaginosum]|uniref:ABM domain-containing protein n=1 Tax=Cutaneotrichosporon oleaginosum TaxID=879819 RepID=A0A0J0XRG3_9TREE|nr:uncharacterized protein CC85DRAFT_327040 [Cutaneotrichosporon oleaginosum]KLT43678.1 hypothetical protein CC85DRAFT_327040 [Cutaneotrichosporon oleaginosum]TXT05097.1 hypothetical protein COLE_06417 [Cutaneotrichosporon oleaginosum]